MISPFWHLLLNPQACKLELSLRAKGQFSSTCLSVSDLFSGPSHPSSLLWSPIYLYFTTGCFHPSLLKVMWWLSGYHKFPGISLRQEDDSSPCNLEISCNIAKFTISFENLVLEFNITIDWLQTNTFYFERSDSTLNIGIKKWSCSQLFINLSSL